MSVANILKIKGSAVMTARPAETLQAVAKRLRQEGVGALVVLSDSGSLEGIITERDVSNGLALYGRGAHALPASALMTTGVATCSPHDKVSDVAKVMTERRMRHLPVKDGARLAGVVSIGDVLKYRLEETQLEARVLRDIAIAIR